LVLGDSCLRRCLITWPNRGSAAVAAPTSRWSMAWSQDIVMRMQPRTKPVELLGRVLAPLGRCLTTDSAKEILSLRAGASARRRLERLAAKSDAGTLTPEERAEYLLFVEVGDLVALLQAKARRHLAEQSAS
jgi:hypothetical protein